MTAAAHKLLDEVMQLLEEDQEWIAESIWNERASAGDPVDSEDWRAEFGGASRN